jgi:hypothetical protein
MASRQSHYITGRPISTSGRWIITGCLMLAAIVLGFAASIVLYQANREMMRESNILGYVLCGEGQHIDDVPVKSGRGRRMICRDAAGTEVTARNNLVSVKMALPFFILFAIPGLMLAWMVDWREARRR